MRAPGLHNKTYSVKKCVGIRQENFVTEKLKGNKMKHKYINNTSNCVSYVMAVGGVNRLAYSTCAFRYRLRLVLMFNCYCNILILATSRY